MKKYKNEMFNLCLEREAAWLLLNMKIRKKNRKSMFKISKNSNGENKRHWCTQCDRVNHSIGIVFNFIALILKRHTT